MFGAGGGASSTSPPVVATELAVRLALKRSLAATHDDGIEIVDEFWIPRSNERVDVALINGALKAFEIKTEQDSLKRLPRQVSAFGHLFEHCTAVLAERHLKQGMTIVPDWWGVLRISTEDEISFKTIRRGDRNPDVNPEFLVRLLWRDEARMALANLGLPPPPTTDRAAMWEALIEHVDTVQLGSIVRNALLQRDPNHARFPSRRFNSSTRAQAAV
jgi:hypothetical protein